MFQPMHRLKFSKPIVISIWHKQWGKCKEHQKTLSTIEESWQWLWNLRKFREKGADMAYAYIQDDRTLPKKWVDTEWIENNTDYPMRRWIREQRLWHVVKLHDSQGIEGLHPEEIRKFYSNMRILFDHPNTILSTMVHNKHITLDYPLINSLLDRNDEGVWFLGERNLRRRYEVHPIAHCMDMPIECNSFDLWRQFVHQFICETLAQNGIVEALWLLKILFYWETLLKEAE